MSSTDFISRVAQKGAPEPRQAQPPKLPKASNRAERLDKSLMILAQHGIGGALAYAPLFRGLRAIGLGPRPLFYWNTVALTVFMFVLATVIFGVTILVCLALGTAPRPIRAMIEAGPVAFVVINFILSVCFAAYHKMTAIRLDLPNWRDL